MQTVNRNLGTFAYIANVIGTSNLGDQIEVDVHLGQTGITMGTSLKSLIDVYHQRLHDLFAKVVLIPLKFAISVVRSHNDGAEHFGSADPFLFIGLVPANSYDAHKIAAYAICEMVECYGATSGLEWDSATSHGEGLSRFIGEAFVPGAMNGIQTVASWLNTTGRPDFITRSAMSETNQVANGCAIAGLHYLHDVLGKSLPDIVGAPGNSLELKYRHLFPRKTGMYAAMRAALDDLHPVGTPVPETMAHENPFKAS